MLNLIKSIFICLLVTIFLLLASCFIHKTAHANDELIQVDELKLQYLDFFSGGSYPLITQNGLPNKTLGKGINLILDSTLFNYTFFNNTISTMTDEDIDSGAGQFRTVAWSFQFGVRLTQYMNIGYAHRSEHILDHVYSQGRFPVQDALLIEFNFINKNKHETLFDWR